MFKRAVPFILLAVILLGSLALPGRPVRAQGTFTVTNCDFSGPGSLYQAITDANNNPGPDNIVFNIPTSDPGYGLRTAGVWTIIPGAMTGLPPLLDDGTTIDGTTQTANQGDTNPAGPEIEVYGALLQGGAVFAVFSSNNTIRGLAIDGDASGGQPAPERGVLISQPAAGNLVAGNYVGVDAAGSSAQPCGNSIEIADAASNNVIDGNVLAGNSYYGLLISGAGASGNQVRRNIVGLNPGGNAAIPNGQAGIAVGAGAQQNVVGGQSDWRNIISGNGQDGVRLESATLNEVSSNYIGVDASGAVDMGNGWNGVALESGAQTNYINNNVIAGNDRHGVWLSGSDVTNNYINGNFIGSNPGGTIGIVNGWHGVAIYNGAYGNAVLNSLIVSSAWSGVAIIDGNSTMVHGNYIGVNWWGADLGNGFHGVVTNGVGNVIELNTIAYNGQATASNGVQIGDPTALNNEVTQNSIFSNGNKGIALVNGGNNNIVAPTIGGTNCGHVDGMACVGCRVEVFSDNGDEGRIYEGMTWADDVSGVFGWDGALHGPHATVTATDSQGNTSEFSAWARGCYRVFLPAIVR